VPTSPTSVDCHGAGTGRAQSCAKTGVCISPNSSALVRASTGSSFILFTRHPLFFDNAASSMHHECRELLVNGFGIRALG
jgi:hypothetical protein